MAMAPDSSDPVVFASIHLLLQKQQQQRLGKSFRSRSSSHSKLLPISSSGMGGYGGSNRRHYKRKSRSCSNSKLPQNYLKPGALAQLRDAQRSARVSSSVCSSKKKKRTESSVDEVNDDDEAAGAGQMGLPQGDAVRSETMRPHQTQGPVVASMTPGPSHRMFGPLCPQRKKLLAPKTPLLPSLTTGTIAAPITPVHSSPPVLPDSRGESLLESIPLELLVRIVCNLHHDQLKPAFHVSKRLRQAVLIARQSHFDFTTP
eukprot:c6369_g1_i1 orf=346-1122(+)